MVTIFIWHVFALPTALDWLAPWLSLSLSLLFWGLAGWLLRVLIDVFVHRIVSRTASDVDDVILEASRTPAVLVVLLLGTYYSFEWTRFHVELATPLVRALILGVIATVTYWAWRLFRDVAIYYARRIVENTETALDDVLLPLVNQIGPLLIGLVGAVVALEYLGVRIESLIVGIGGASFILAFALQDILANIFSGLSLAVDTPFAYRDLIVLSDGTVCEVRRIGLRVTELYNINSHSIIYVPNSHLANERLVNMTRPSPDLIDTLQVSVDEAADLDQVRALLDSVVLGHPDILGDLDAKLKHLPNFLSLEAGQAKIENGRLRLELEQQLNGRLNDIHGKIDRLVARARRLARGGLTGSEIRTLRAEFMLLLDDFGVVPAENGKGRRRRPAVRYASRSDSLIGLVHEWVTVWACDPALGGTPDTRLDVAALWEEAIDQPLNDPQLLVMQWNRRVRLLVNRLSSVYAKFCEPRGWEQRLGDLLLELANWLRNNFKEATAAWKNPDVNFTGPDDRGMAFAIEFFIDDIELEHYERQERVRRELQMEIVRRLRAAQIGLPFAQQVISLRPGLAAPGSH